MGDGDRDLAGRTCRKGGRSQPVDATLVCSLLAGVSKPKVFRWHKEYGGLQVDQARRLKELEQENAKLKRLGSEPSLEKLVLKIKLNLDIDIGQN
jgi:hypothetical protein